MPTVTMMHSISWHILVYSVRSVTSMSPEHKQSRQRSINIKTLLSTESLPWFTPTWWLPCTEGCMHDTSRDSYPGSIYCPGHGMPARLESHKIFANVLIIKTCFRNFWKKSTAKHDICDYIISSQVACHQMLIIVTDNLLSIQMVISTELLP